MINLKTLIFNSDRNSIFESIVNSYNTLFEDMRIPPSIESWLSDSVVKIPVYITAQVNHSINLMTQKLAQKIILVVEYIFLIPHKM